MSRRNTQRAERLKIANPQLPWNKLVNPLKPVEVLSLDQVEHIHQASLRVLAETGMEFMDPGARAVLAGAGCDVDEDTMRVRFDPGFIEEHIAKAPSHFSLRARNPQRSLDMAGPTSTSSPSSAPLIATISTAAAAPARRRTCANSSGFCIR